MDIIQKAKEIILEEIPNVIAISVFGSYANQTQNEQSDLDLAILCEKKLIKNFFGIFPKK